MDACFLQGLRLVALFVKLLIGLPRSLAVFGIFVVALIYELVHFGTESVLDGSDVFDVAALLHLCLLESFYKLVLCVVRVVNFFDIFALLSDGLVLCIKFSVEGVKECTGVVALVFKGFEAGGAVVDSCCHSHRSSDGVI